MDLRCLESSWVMENEINPQCPYANPDVACRRFLKDSLKIVF